MISIFTNIISLLLGLNAIFFVFISDQIHLREQKI